MNRPKRLRRTNRYTLFNSTLKRARQENERSRVFNNKYLGSENSVVENHFYYKEFSIEFYTNISILWKVTAVCGHVFKKTGIRVSQHVRTTTDNWNNCGSYQIAER